MIWSIMRVSEVLRSHDNVEEGKTRTTIHYSSDCVYCVVTTQFTHLQNAFFHSSLKKRKARSLRRKIMNNVS